MNLEARKISFIQEYLKIDNEKIINAIENFFNKTKSEIFEDSLTPMSVEKFNSEIEEALKDEETGRLIDAAVLRENVEKWQ